VDDCAAIRSGINATLTKQASKQYNDFINKFILVWKIAILKFDYWTDKKRDGYLKFSAE